MSYQDTILTQYAASEKLLAIIDTFDQVLSPDDFTDEFITRVWDLTTCEAFGLDIWGKIVGVSRYITASIDNSAFGFAQADEGKPDYPTPFNEAPFFAGVQETTKVRLSDNAYRTLILSKAFSNISIATLPEMNQFLRFLFKDRGQAFCVNYRDMTIGITTTFPLEPFEIAVLSNTDVTPLPSGVLMRVNQVVAPYFGFAEDAFPFNDGTFYTALG